MAFTNGTYIDGFEDIRLTSPIGTVQNDNLRIKLNLLHPCNYETGIIAVSQFSPIMPPLE